jgi:hypothetical protein
MLIARSASDKTEDWPFWMIWDGIVNVTADVCNSLGIDRGPGQVLGCREDIEIITEMYNGQAQQ